MRWRVLQRLCANEIDVPVGPMVYTRDAQRARRLRERPHGDARRRADRFLIVTGSAQAHARRRLDRAPHRRATSTRCSPTSARMYCVLSLMGPNARELLARVSPDDLSPRGAEVLAHARDRPRPRARARGAHELCRRARLRAVRAGGDGAPRLPRAARRRARGPRACATPATTRSMRCASRPGRRAWGAELGPDETPFEAGLALRGQARQAEPTSSAARRCWRRATSRCARSCVTVVLDDPHAWAWGGEAIVDRRPAGRRAGSVGWSPQAGACVGLGYVRGDAAQQPHAGTPLQIDLWGEPIPAAAWDRWPPKLAAAGTP